MKSNRVSLFALLMCLFLGYILFIQINSTGNISRTILAQSDVIDEEGIVRQAILQAIPRYKGNIHPDYANSIIEIEIDGQWAYGLIEWTASSGENTQFVVLAHQLPNGEWITAVPQDPKFTDWISLTPFKLFEHPKNTLHLPLIDDRKLIQLDNDAFIVVEEQIKTSLSNEHADYEIWSLRMIENWAYFSLVLLEKDPSNTDEYEITRLHIALAEFYPNIDEPVIYLENTDEFKNALQRLPDQLQWLIDLEKTKDLEKTNAPESVYSITGLPWILNTSWRYNQGPLTPFHANEFDFGVPTVGVQNSVYAADSGNVVSTSGTCVWIQRGSDGLRLFYQHLNSNDIGNLWIGQPINYGDFLGKTTVSSGCDGSTTNHHVHFSFYSPYSGGVLNPQGFSMNGWLVQGNTLVKDGHVRSANFNDTLLHSSTGGSSNQVRLYDAPNMGGNVLHSLGTGLHNDPHPPIFSMSMPAGWSAITYDQDDGGGDSKCWNSDVNNFQDYSDWSNRLRSIRVHSYNACPAATATPVPSSQVKLYSEPNMGGNVLHSLGTGLHNDPHPPIFSMSMPAGWSAITYDQDNGGGDFRCWDSNVNNFQDHSDWSNRLRSIRIHSYNACPVAPASPTNLSASGTTADSISLAWQDNSNNETGFKIYRWGFNGTDWEFMYLDSVGANVTSYTNTNLLCNTTYFYEVSAYGAGGESNHTAFIEVSTAVCPQPGPLSIGNFYIDDDMVDDSVGNNDGSVNCGESIELYLGVYNAGANATGVSASISTDDPYVTWIYDTVSDYPDINSGQVQQNNNDFDFVLSSQTPHNHEINFTLQMIAENGGEWFDSVSIPVTCDIPNIPSGLTVNSTIQDTLTLSWQDNANNETGFHIYRWGYNGTDWEFLYHDSVSSNVTTYTDTGLACGTTYFYEVSAYSDVGESAHTGWVDEETLDCPVVTSTNTPAATTGAATSTPTATQVPMQTPIATTTSAPTHPAPTQTPVATTAATPVAIPSDKMMPYWRTVLLVYKNIDVDYTDSEGVPRHLTHTMPPSEIEDGVSAFRRYLALAHDGSNAEAFVQYDIIYVDRPLTSLTSMGTNLWWPSPTDTHQELDAYVPGKYDSVLVLWPQTNFTTGQQIPSHWGLGLYPTSWANDATYGTVANAPTWMWEVPSMGEPWLHEWLHGVSPFYADQGFLMPTGDADGGSSHGYVHSATTGWMDYYDDLMTGNVMENNTLTGITAAAWQSGAILGNRSHVFADYFRTDSLASYQQVGSVTWDAANERVQMNGNPVTSSQIDTAVAFQDDFTVVGRVNIPEVNIGLYDSISVVLSNEQVEYWGILAYGTALAERNHISIMRNDTWGELYPLSLGSGWYTLKMDVDHGANMMRLKVWPDGTNEPAWQVMRELDAGWTAANLGYRHFGTGTTFVDDLYAIEAVNQTYLPMIMR